MKKLGEIVTVLALLGLTGASAVAETPYESTPAVQYVYVQEEPSFYDQFAVQGPLAQLALEYEYELELRELKIETLAAEEDRYEALQELQEKTFEQDQIEIDAAIAALWPYVGVTQYGFGTTPDRWDCSGLTLWYLEQRGITDVIHSATAQVRDYRSTIVEEPIPGDLVAFQYSGARSYFHIGVYVGGGYMIHAANPDKDTAFQTVSSFAESENSKVAYIRY